MSQPILAVGVDPAKRVHRAVEAIRDVDTRLADLAITHGADLAYGLEDHRRYGRLVCQVPSERGRDVRVVNPLWTNRQRAFYGQDKDDAIDDRGRILVGGGSGLRGRGLERRLGWLRRRLLRSRSRLLLRLVGLLIRLRLGG